MWRHAYSFAQPIFIHRSHLSGPSRLLCLWLVPYRQLCGAAVLISKTGKVRQHKSKAVACSHIANNQWDREWSRSLDPSPAWSCPALPLAVGRTFLYPETFQPDLLHLRVSLENQNPVFLLLTRKHTCHQEEKHAFWVWLPKLHVPLSVPFSGLYPRAAHTHPRSWGASWCVCFCLRRGRLPVGRMWLL